MQTTHLCNTGTHILNITTCIHLTHDFCPAHCICAVSVDKLHWQRLYFYQSYSFSLLFRRIYTIVSSAYILCSLNKLTVCKSNMELRYHNRGGNTCALLPYENLVNDGTVQKDDWSLFLLTPIVNVDKIINPVQSFIPSRMWTSLQTDDVNIYMLQDSLWLKQTHQF